MNFFFIVTEPEFRRLQEAFKRVCTSNTYITKQAFSHEVLGDLVPQDIAEVLYMLNVYLCNFYKFNVHVMCEKLTKH